MKDHFYLSRHLLLAIALYPTQQNWKCLHVRNRQYTEFNNSNFWSPRSLWSKPRFLGFDFQTNFDHKAQKMKLFLVGALKRYLNEKNLIHGRVLAKISKFSPQIFETYYKNIQKVASQRLDPF